MRIALGIWLAGVGLALAQQPPAGVNPINVNPAGQAAVANPRLDQLLQQWEQKMKTVNALEATVVRTETDPIDKVAQVYEGKAKFLRPDRASLYLTKKSNPSIFENYIYTGKSLYEYRPQTKQLRIHELPPPKPGGQMMDDTFLAFLSGMKADDAKKRYGLSLLKEDEHYVYIEVNPKLPADMQEFKRARLALWKANFLPRELSFEAPNGMVTKWDLPTMDVVARLKAEDFAPPQAPRDWQVQKVPQQQAAAPTQPPAPTKVRPAGQ